MGEREVGQTRQSAGQERSAGQRHKGRPPLRQPALGTQASRIALSSSPEPGVGLAMDAHTSFCTGFVDKWSPELTSFQFPLKMNLSLKKKNHFLFRIKDMDLEAHPKKKINP